MPLVIFLVLIVDQISKWIVCEYMFRPALGLGEPMHMLDWLQSPERLPFVTIPVLPFFNLTMVWNEGVGFGMLQGAGVWILVALSVVVSVILWRWAVKSGDAAQHMIVGAIIGGALGNVLDRLRYGAVVDFIDLHAYGWHYPVFNIADSAIVVGAILLLLKDLFRGKVKP